MKLAARINSYQREGCGGGLAHVFDRLARVGVTHVDLNYPEHSDRGAPAAMREMLEQRHLSLNGVALRFRSDFIRGGFANPDASVARRAVDLCKGASDYCREAGGAILTVWPAYDGFDYSFQTDYARAFDAIVTSFDALCDYAPDLKVSIEYKPFQPRAYALVDSMGMAAMVLDACARDNLGVTLDYCHMLMKHENPAFAADLFGRSGKLFGVHLNDGYGLNDDGVMVGMASPGKTLELLFYLKKRSYRNAIYFDTFPQAEDAEEETAQNIAMLSLLDRAISSIGTERIQRVIDQGDAVEAVKLVRSMYTTMGGAS